MTRPKYITIEGKPRERWASTAYFSRGRISQPSDRTGATDGPPEGRCSGPAPMWRTVDRGICRCGELGTTSFGKLTISFY